MNERWQAIPVYSTFQQVFLDCGHQLIEVGLGGWELDAMGYRLACGMCSEIRTVVKMLELHHPAFDRLT
jgi:hypothetical protein